MLCCPLEYGVLRLSSIEWTSIGNELYTGHISLRDFYLSRSVCPASLHDVQICKIAVTDHLGEDILVPTMFCSAEEVGVSSLLILLAL